jgi:hypothetical protein
MTFIKKFTIQKRELEFLSALYLLGWGLWILNPWAESFVSSSIYRQMALLAPEWMWGIVVSAIGLFQMIAICTDNCRLRAAASVISMFTLVSMSLLVLYGNPASTAGVTYMVIAICSWFGFTEILSDWKEGKIHGKK